MIPLIVLTLLTPPSDTLRFGPEDIDALPAATTRVERGGRLIVELPAVEVPAEATIRTPVYRVSVPFAVSLYGFAVEVADGAGGALPPDRLHHVVFTDPNRRELFLPLALPIFAASKESPRPVFPKYRVGVVLPASTRYIVAAMFANPESRPRPMVVRLVLSFVRPGRIVPLAWAYAWTMDVTYPLGGAGGRHDFDLPPGRSSYSWEASPQIPGTIVAMGGHAHDYATAIQFEDVTAAKTIWRQVPVHDTAGYVHDIPGTRFTRWYRLGVHIEPSHTYRVSVVYDNPTGVRIPFGGMGSVAGLFVPDRRQAWPRLDPRDPVYRAQINNLLTNMAGAEMVETASHHH